MRSRTIQELRIAPSSSETGQLLPAFSWDTSASGPWPILFTHVKHVRLHGLYKPPESAESLNFKKDFSTHSGNYIYNIIYIYIYVYTFTSNPSINSQDSKSRTFAFFLFFLVSSSSASMSAERWDLRSSRKLFNPAILGGAIGFSWSLGFPD